MKKNLLCIVTLLLALTLLAGCGASNAATKMEYDTKSPGDVITMDSYSSGGSGSVYNSAAESIVMEDAGAMPVAPSAGSVLPQNVKMIYTAYVNLESTKFDAAVEALASLTADCGGYYEVSSLDNAQNTYRSANYTIRIPAPAYDGFCTTIANIGAAGETFQLNSIDRSARNVSEEYYDVESRLTTQKTKLERLQALLKQAEKMEDIITLESAISETELTIEQLTGSLRKYDSLVDYATVTVSLREVYQLTALEEPAIGFGAKLATAFQAGCRSFVRGLENVALAIARGWIGWLIFLAIVAAAVIIPVRIHRKKKAARQAPKEEKAE